MKKGTKKKYLIILLIVLLLGLAVGYAVFSDTLRITGTANAKGSFDVIFTNCTETIEGANIASTRAATNISADGDTLTVNAVDLGYPGAYVQYQVTIKNVGSIPAKVKSFDKTGGSDHIEIVGTTTEPAGSSTSIPVGEVLAPNEECTYTFYVRWIKDTEDITDPSVEFTEDTEFTMTIVYEQEITESNPVESHTH